MISLPEANMPTLDQASSCGASARLRHTSPAAGRCVVCGACGTPALHVVGYTLLRCVQCGHQYLPLAASSAHVEQVYGDSYFSGGGDGYSDYLGDARLLTYRGKWYARLLARYVSPRAVLDVGAAAGFTLRGFQEAGWQCAGVEPNRSMAEYAKQQFNLDVATGTWEAWETTQAFDLVTMLQVIPHFADPRAALAKAREFLRPGGFVLIETWNRDSWSARLLGKHWHEYSPPSVLHWFNRKGLECLARGVGLDAVAHGRPAKWISAAHAQSLLKTKAAESTLNRLLYRISRLIPGRISLPYFAEDLFWLLLRRT